MITTSDMNVSQKQEAVRFADKRNKTKRQIPSVKSTHYIASMHLQNYMANNIMAMLHYFPCTRHSDKETRGAKDICLGCAQMFLIK